MTDKRETQSFSRIMLAGAIFVALTASRAWAATDTACLTGTDPSVAADAAQIEALEAQIAAACPCATFDGSDGKERGDYRKCVSPLIKAAVVNGQLRAQCKARLGKAHKLSSCGAIGVLPCLESKGDKIRCRIVTAETCQSDSRYTRTACASSRRCVDAGDGNGDYLVDGSDSFQCRMPAAATPTPTATATATEPVEDTATPTVEPTQTPTVVPTDPPTAVPTETPTSAPTDTATHAATPTSTATPTSEIPTPTVAVCNQSAAIIPHVDVNLEDDPQSPPLPPDPRALNCFPQTISGGGCKLNILEGSIDNVFDASASFDPARCPGDPAPSYHWEIFLPPINGGALYPSSGITGYDDPVLRIRPNALPSLSTTSDPFWRVRLTITSNVTSQTSRTWFRFEYDTTCTTVGGCAN